MTTVSWVGITITSLVLAYIIKIILWPSWKDIPRENFAHYIRGLIRFYDDSAWIVITIKTSSTPVFRFCRSGTNGDGCTLLFEILNSPLTASNCNDLQVEIRNQGYEPILPDKMDDSDWLIRVMVKIEDIWQISTGNHIARLAHATLDIMGIDKEARFSISGKGPRSRKRTLEARQLQKEGYDLGGTDLKK